MTTGPMLRAEELQVATLGPRAFASSLGRSPVDSVGEGRRNYTPDDARVLYEIEFTDPSPGDAAAAFERAGARQELFFDPAVVRAAIVTCGGLCPGLNNVIRTVYYELVKNYGAREVLGVRYGYSGLNEATGVPPVVLTDAMVDEIHKDGGTMLGTCRGPETAAHVVDFLQRRAVDMLFCVGGDGTQRGAHAIHLEVARRGAKISIVGIPKTIDNDIPFVWRSFGFSTAIEKAMDVIDSAHNEARGVRNGIALVRLMGRQSGFIACGATLASGQANFTFIPEVPFALEGDSGLFARLERRLAARGHAVIVVAEGAGQDLVSQGPPEFDASGNPNLQDIGPFLKTKIAQHFAAHGAPVAIKYLDPSYYIRSVPANSADSLLCDQYGRFAVHAAMAGKTDLLVGLWNNQFIHVPLSVAAQGPRKVSPEGDLWSSVLSVTGQEKW